MTHKTAQKAQDNLRLSFEYFPPSNDFGAQKLWRAVTMHARFAPDFVSVTYGAGGSTQDRTFKLVEKLKSRTQLDVAGHLTCADASCEEVLAAAQAYKDLGVTRIVALRGDGANGTFQPHPEGFANSLELIESLKLHGFDVTVGAYPEAHPDSQGEAADIDHLKAKFDAGADRAITQFFYQKDTFLRWRDKCMAAGIDQPLIPGILPIENFNKVNNFANKVGSKIPDWLMHAFRNTRTDEDAHLLAVAQSCELITNLQDEGVDHVHFYTLNNPQLCADICTALGHEKQPMKALSVA